MITIIRVFATLYAAYIAFALAVSRFLNGSGEGRRFDDQPRPSRNVIGRES